MAIGFMIRLSVYKVMFRNLFRLKFKLDSLFSFVLAFLLITQTYSRSGLDLGLVF